MEMRNYSPQRALTWKRRAEAGGCTVVREVRARYLLGGAVCLVVFSSY
jgi:hypothetical protein